jgi:sensor histidine kinase regulating citrate/malate metabolism
MVASAFYLRKFNFDDLPNVPNSGLTLILMGNFSLLLLYVTENFFFGLDYSVVITLLIAYVCMFCMMMAAINATYTLCSEQGSIISLQTEKQRLLSEREMIQMAEASLEDLRCVRHDLKNQYAYMQILLQEERYEDLKHYFSQVSENLPSQLNMIECGNHTMNTILNMAFSKLKSERISVEHQLVIPPVLPFPDDDMCAIVINLMDNAADECRRLLQNGMDNIGLRLEIYPYRSYLYIMCSNSTDRKELSRLQSGIRTTKKDTQLHGYGTRIVSKLAEKHNGCAEFSLQEDHFVAKVMLDMTGEEQINED